MRVRVLEVPVAPSVLRWARETIGKTIEEVARRLDLGSEMVQSWETGGKRPTLKQLRKLTVFYKRPLAAFFLPAPPTELPLPTDYRSLPEAVRKPFSEKTLLALRRARRLQEISRDLSSGLEQRTSPRIPRTTLADDPRALAVCTRRDIGLTLDEQSRCPNPAAALAKWKNGIESRGVLVLELGFPVPEGRALALSDDSFPIIVLNSNDVYHGRIFSLFHEYAHLSLHDSGICDLSENGKTTEKFCNRFAGEFLVPQEALLAHPAVAGPRSRRAWDDEELNALGRFFKVSREVVLRRLLTVGLTSQTFYEQKHREWEAELRETPRRRRGRRVPARQCVRQNGIPFTSLVLESAQQERITYRDVSDFLSIRLKYLPAVEAIVKEASARHA